MRFTKRKQLRLDYIHNTKKYITKFLWWPITIDGETRWLETAHMLYKVKEYEDPLCYKSYYYWAPWQFINE